MLTFGVKGFVLESANMTDDDDEMRVEGLGRGSPHRACNQLGQDTEHPLTHPEPAFRVPHSTSPRQSCQWLGLASCSGFLLSCSSSSSPPLTS
jgi:hypothetical protein